MANYRLFVWIMVVIALVVAILGVALPVNQLGFVMVITNFFELMLPILAFAALIKYLMCCPKKNCD